MAAVRVLSMAAWSWARARSSGPKEPVHDRRRKQRVIGLCRGASRGQSRGTGRWASRFWPAESVWISEASRAMESKEASAKEMLAARVGS